MFIVIVVGLGIILFVGIAIEVRASTDYENYRQTGL